MSKNKQNSNVKKRNALQSKFQQSNLYNNFGNVLLSIYVQGFRCHTNTLIEIKSPITAFCGLNGVGKSTLIQLAAVAYLSNEETPKYIHDFIISHKLDPKPFTDDAKVLYKYCSDTKELKEVTISKQKQITGGWNGYIRRPKRTVLYVGVGEYLPKNENYDYMNTNPEEVEITSEKSVDEDIQKWCCKILSKKYEQMSSHLLKYKDITHEIHSVKINGLTYSEPHMGYGEARSQYLVRLIENLPAKSLIILEEPEISLHPSAQYYFGSYLVDVSLRKGHQIFLTTHSESLLSALHSNSRIYLEKTSEGVEQRPGLTPSQAYSLMTEGYIKSLHIFVEDEEDKPVAKFILTEIIRKIDIRFLDCVGIYAVGSSDNVKRTVRALKETNIAAAGVLDAGPEQIAIPKENIFVLPGKLAPEKELFASDAVKEYIHSTYKINLEDFHASKLVDLDHHEWFKKLAERISMNEVALITEVCKIFASSLSELDISTLVKQLKEASER